MKALQLLYLIGIPLSLIIGEICFIKFRKMETSISEIKYSLLHGVFILLALACIVFVVIAVGMGASDASDNFVYMIHGIFITFIVYTIFSIGLMVKNKTNEKS